MHNQRARLVLDPEGLNSAAPAETLAASLETPEAAFFTRSHAAPPVIDPGAWRLEVAGMVDQPGHWSLADLDTRFPRRTVDAALVCAGLRRLEFLSLGPLPGELPWGEEPAGCGRWGGTGLADLLTAAGVQAGARYVEFIGLDTVERHGRRFGFGGSIPVDKALSGEVLVARDLNGARLSAAHGHPARIIVPGWIGARSVKWLGRIVVRADPSDNYFQAEAYRFQRERNEDDPRDVRQGQAMTDVPLNSVILDPAARTRRPAGPNRFRGWAIGGGGAPLTGIWLSADDGGHWAPATILPGASRWTWTFWEATVDLRPGHHTVVVRAEDNTGARQPASIRETWNVKGYGNNAWHRVPVIVD